MLFVLNILVLLLNHLNNADVHVYLTQNETN